MNKFGLDIIIPTYKNIEGLEKTLDSFYCQDIFKWSKQLEFPINITIVDDYSEVDYSKIYNKYSNITILFNKINCGPGIARQYGIQVTKLPYIMFIDTEDYLLSKYNILEIMLTIKQKPTLFMYSWGYIDEQFQQYIHTTSPLLRGTVYSRQFLKKYEITFCPQSSYADEDVGFNRVCQLIITELGDFNNENMIQFFNDPIYMYTYNGNSITRKNNRQFLYKKQLPALISNTYHVIKIGEKNHISQKLLWEQVSYILVRLYYDFRVIMLKNKQCAQENWDLLKKYYKQLYCKYKMQDITIQRVAIGHNMRRLMHLEITNVNFNKFLKQLENEEKVPEYYFEK